MAETAPTHKDEKEPMAQYQTTLVMDQRTADSLRELKEQLGASNNSQVIRKALALARLVARNANADNEFEFIGPDGKHKTVILD